MKTISEKRIKNCLEILGKGTNEKQIIKERLERLSFQFLFLLDEIEEFGRVVYCKDAAACWLGDDVLEILAPVNLRKTLNLEDGDNVEVVVTVELHKL